MHIVIELEVNTEDGSIEELDRDGWQRVFGRAFPLATSTEVQVLAAYEQPDPDGDEIPY